MENGFGPKRYIPKQIKMADDNKSIASEDSWEEVYVEKRSSDKHWNEMFGEHEHLQFFKQKRKTKKGHWSSVYFQTFGGGPEGGYIERMFWNAEGHIEERLVYAVERTWGEPFSVKLMSGKKVQRHLDEDDNTIDSKIKVVDRWSE